jgi:hypothetical protein
VRKTFDRWLAHSAARFRHPPRVVLSRKRYVEMRFVGVTPAIRCSISTEGMVGLYASYQGEWWDVLAESDVVARRTSTGHYACGLCTSPEMFASRAALWVPHSFCAGLSLDECPLPGLAMVTSLSSGGATWARLTPKKDMHGRETIAHLVYACPVVRGRPSQTPGAWRPPSEA